MLQFIKIVFLFLFINNTVTAAGYENVFDIVKFSHVQSIDISGSKIFYHGHSRDETKRYLNDISTMSQELQSYYHDSKKCSDVTLNVYSVDFDTLNNRDIFSFLSWEEWDNKNIGGIYDTRFSPHSSAAIFISTNRGDKKTTSILAHEIAHYWQHTRCLGQNEEGARMFSELYISGKT